MLTKKYLECACCLFDFICYFSNLNVLFIFSAPCEDLKALIAQAHRSVYRRESVPVITDLIDNIMSIPSCLQDTNSKVTLVREWIKQNPKPEKIDLPEPVRTPEDGEKLKWGDTPKVR